MAHTFGGDWTSAKLEVMRRYFASYAIALRNQKFECWYVDAFAGTGERGDRKGKAPTGPSLFGTDDDEIAAVKDGSARIALELNPSFRRYIFIDTSTKHVMSLQSLQTEFSTRQIFVQHDDANAALRRIARMTDWRKTRAAIFIDPYGMQVDWETLVALKNTRAVDIALLFPTGPLIRMLANDGNIPPEWEKRIDAHLGPCKWREAAYSEVGNGDLFSASAKKRKVMTAESLRAFVQSRLESIFPYVCEKQLDLRNSRNAVLYHLFLICANPSPAAVKLATKLARAAMAQPKKRT